MSIDSDTSPPILESETRILSVNVKTVEGLEFTTEIGNQQVAVSILFPGHMNDVMSPLVPPSANVQFDFTEEYTINFYPDSTINALLRGPLEFFVYVCTPDMKKCSQVARFVFPFNELLFNRSYTATIDGSVLPDGDKILPDKGIKADINFSWDRDIFQPEFLEESLIATVNIQQITELPEAMMKCSAQPNNFATHFFTYSLFAQLPDGQILWLDGGRPIQSSTDSKLSGDGFTASIAFPNSQKFFLGPESFSRWKEAAENNEIVSLYLIPEISPLLSPLGLVPNQYSVLFGRADIPLNQFAVPGRSHVSLTMTLVHDTKLCGIEHPVTPLTPNGFPPEPPVDPKSKKGPARKGNTSQGSKAKSQSNAAAKKPKPLSKKEKQIMQNIIDTLGPKEDAEEDNEACDIFKESTTTVKGEFVLSKPLVPRLATPIASKMPEEIIPPLPRIHDSRLADATAEFCRQLSIAVNQIENDDNPNLRSLIKEQIKPSIVNIVQQVFQKKDPPKADLSKTRANLSDSEKPEPPVNENKIEVNNLHSKSFLSELRSYLLLHLNKTINNRFNLSYPQEIPEIPQMDIDTLTKRIAAHEIFKTGDVGPLYQRRCDLDSLNPVWCCEYALHLVDMKDDRYIDMFSRAIAINYNYKEAILGFVAQVCKNYDKGDALPFLKHLDSMRPNDPTVTVCLLIVYTLAESSKCDEFLAKISSIAQNTPKSPYLMAASSLLDVHDTFLSELIINREQMQNGRSKDLLVALARFNNLIGEHSRAQEYLREALEFDREDHSVWKMLGDFQFNCGMKEKAKASYISLLTSSGEPDLDVCLKLSIIRIQDSEYDLAYDMLMYVVQKTDNMLAWMALGVCCLRKGEYEEADVALSHANELDRWYPETWGYCALLCAKMGRVTEGQQALSFAEELGLRDYRLIQELREEFKNLPNLSEELTSCLHRLSSIREEDCYESFEQHSEFSDQGVSENNENL